MPDNAESLDTEMNRSALLTVALCAVFSAAMAVEEAEPQFHDDYYAGFAQGFYYGLLLSGEDYELAWCMKSELGYEAESLGTGEAFQKKLESMLAKCRSESNKE
jgi:hypothetical protein